MLRRPNVNRLWLLPTAGGLERRVEGFEASAFVDSHLQPEHGVDCDVQVLMRIQ